MFTKKTGQVGRGTTILSNEISIHQVRDLVPNPCGSLLRSAVEGEMKKEVDDDDMIFLYFEKN